MTDDNGQELFFCGIIGLLILSLLYIGWQDPVNDILGDGLDSEFAAADGRRIADTVRQLSGRGSATATLSLQSGLSATFVEGAVHVGGIEDPAAQQRLPSQFTYSGSGQGKICLVKQGLSVLLTPAPCPQISCTTGQCSVNQQRVGDSRLVTGGYICQQGVYTADGFYTQYYTEASKGCGGRQPHEFAEINTVNCPDKVSNGVYGCFMEATWRCPAGNATVRIATQEMIAEESVTCTDRVQHHRFGTPLNLSTGDHDITASVRIPGNATDTVTVRMTVDGDSS